MDAPEAIVINGDIRTMDVHFPRVEALAIQAGRIVALGSNEDIRALAQDATTVIDARGRLVLPGFHDTHLHVQDGGQYTSQSVDLSGATSAAEMQALLRMAAGS